MTTPSERRVTTGSFEFETVTTSFDQDTTTTTSGEGAVRTSFEMYRDRAGETRWRLRAANGRIIADSGEGYVDRDDALHGIELVRCLAPVAPLEDLTGEPGGEPTGEPEDDRTGDGGDSPVSDYDLGGLPAELEIRWPEPPTIEQEETITSTDGDTVRCDRPHTRYLIETEVNRLVVGASDVAIAVAEEARVGSAFVEREVARVRFDGGRYGSIELAVPADFTTDPPTWREAWLVADVLVEGVDIDAPDGGLILRGKRIAVLSSRIHARRYPIWVGDTDDFRSEDVIVADSELVADGPEATLRMVSVLRSVVVDNVLSNPQKHNYRVEGASDLAFAARNTLVDAGLMLASQPGDDVGTVWFRENVLHHRTHSLLVVDDPPGSQLRRFVASDNTVYSDDWDCFLCVEAPAGWDVVEHTIRPYQPYPA
jgi:uncharacterized protein YegP (UPF0339 family)